MFLRKNFDKRTGIYRSKDPIDNFRFRITLKTVHSFVKIPKFDAEQLSDAEDLDKIEYYNFIWQQKAFSLREIEYFSKLENCKTDVEKSYHERILNHELEHSDENVSKRIFSYVSDDKYAPKDDDEAIFQSNWRKLAKFVEITSEAEELVAIEELNGLIKEPLNRDDAIKLRYKDLGPFESMYILAELERELQLFTIKYRPSDGLLLVYPDFNKIDVNPYLKEINLDSRRLYQYSIENLSNVSQNEDWLLKTDIDAIANKLYDLSLKTPLLFNIPPHYCTNICLCIEIQSARDFEYDNIHVKYKVILPEKCTLIDGDLIGSTHSSSKSSIDNVWLIGHCHEINILCTPNYQFDNPLKIIYEVVSIDQWTRERTEGYAITSFTFSAGREMDEFQCYRDLGDDSWKNWLDRYFIGGRKKVLLQEFNGLKDTIGEEVHKLNRYGNKTVTTGTITIVRNTVIQRNHEKNSNNKTANKQKHHKQNRKQTMISNVLSAYQEARERLAAISEK